MVALSLLAPSPCTALTAWAGSALALTFRRLGNAKLERRAAPVPRAV